MVEFVGMIGTRHVSEIHPATGPVIDPAFVQRFARATRTAASTAS